ncbi:TadA family conjugal transfer-associated ATPase [Actinoalloteichus spitiensis]|uniref:TadA family conjugal transfer-associated ATPase n=1 Tax=Actinoalloteichus spitiensis TaxID=252394 RepID=UPI00037B5C5C|nr:TadA family conjugal transfer-associated ATPase [Actinoalloteichus spitiensis]
MNTPTSTARDQRVHSGALVARTRRRLAESASPTTPTAIARAVRAEAGVVSHADVLHALRVLHQEFAGLGPLAELVRDSAITDVLVTAPDEVWVDRGGGLIRADASFDSEDAVRRLAQRLAAAVGRRLDEASPFVDAWLPETMSHGEVRLHAVLPPVVRSTSLSLRVLRPAAHSLAGLRDSGTFDEDIAVLLRQVVLARLAFLVVGGTGSGKTTLLAAMLGAVPPGERVVCVEDAHELRPDHPHFVRLVVRPPNVEGAGRISTRDLVRQALRMRPDRLVVGEVRGEEVCELLAALNTGHEGGAGTLHANSPAEVPARVEALAALGGLGRTALHSQLGAAVRLVLHMVRLPGGSRVLDSISLLSKETDRVVVTPAWRREAGRGPAWEHLAGLLRHRGGWASCSA